MKTKVIKIKKLSPLLFYYKQSRTTKVMELNNAVTYFGKKIEKPILKILKGGQ